MPKFEDRKKPYLYLNLIAAEDPVLNHHLVSNVLDVMDHMLDFSLIRCQM